MGAGLILLLTRMRQKDERKNHGKWGRSKLFRWSGDFITDIPDEPHEYSMYIEGEG
jgi:hypothetical protein